MPSGLRLRVGCFGLVVAGVGIAWLSFAWTHEKPGRSEFVADASAAPAPPDTLAPVFRPCAHCHEIGAGARHKTGPYLNDLIGRPAGRVAGYPFSPAMRASGLVWDEATLARFLRNPQEVVPGTRMPLSGIASEADLTALLAFLREPSARQQAPR